jgi:hypothetical protein
MAWSLAWLLAGLLVVLGLLGVAEVAAASRRPTLRLIPVRIRPTRPPL